MHENLKSAKANVGLFSRLFIACQTRNGDLKTFFEHENQTAPLSSGNGNLCLAKKKSGILACLLKDDHEEICQSPEVDAKVIDG